jgi:hypothetical protein
MYLETRDSDRPVNPVSVQASWNMCLTSSGGHRSNDMMVLKFKFSVTLCKVFQMMSMSAYAGWFGIA